MQNNTPEESTKHEPIITVERVSRWCDILDEMFGKTKPKNENN